MIEGAGRSKRQRPSAVDRYIVDLLRGGRSAAGVRPRRADPQGRRLTAAREAAARSGGRVGVGPTDETA